MTQAISDLTPTRPIGLYSDGRLKLTIYAQDGSLIDLPTADTPHNRRFIVWLRQHDRYTVGAGECT